MDEQLLCVRNIGPSEVRHRVLMGVFGLLAAAFLAWQLLSPEFSRWLRLLLFLPAYVSLMGFLQAKEKT